MTLQCEPGGILDMPIADLERWATKCRQHQDALEASMKQASGKK
jgi:hypothetical protein